MKIYYKIYLIISIFIFILNCSDKKKNNETIDTETSLSTSISGTASAQTIETLSGSLAKIYYSKINKMEAAASGCGNSNFSVLAVGSGGSNLYSSQANADGSFKIENLDNSNEYVLIFECASPITEFLKTMKCLGKPGDINLICDPVSNAVIRAIEQKTKKILEETTTLQGLEIAEQTEQIINDIKTAALNNTSSTIIQDIENSTSLTSLVNLLENDSDVGTLISTNIMNIETEINQTEQANLNLSVCADGNIEGVEVCDDGNTANNDGCSSTCQPEFCGNMIVESNEECDDGFLTSTCNLSCNLRNTFTWISDADTVNQTGIYGIKGTASPSNIPGARRAYVSWIDSSDNFWLFGGYGNDSAGTLGPLNDLWKFDGTNWTWISGSNIINQAGVYGTKGIAAATNIPGARYFSISWTDSSGNFWLFGGNGYDSTGTTAGLLNDLWKFDGTNWTWINGSNTINNTGVYGTKGTAAATNIPGARNNAAKWQDTSGNFWLFGGNGYDTGTTAGLLNDLWKFDGTNWTWINGSNIINQTGIYGTKGTAAAANIPGARTGSGAWIDTSGNLWLFGGNGYDSTGTSGLINDLWKFDATNWTWINGSNTINNIGVYGTKGTAAAANIPGARSIPLTWINSSGIVYIFGGNGYDSISQTSNHKLNDFWKFDGTSWTWINGTNTLDQNGVYGTKGIATSSNMPGARSARSTWIDSSGNLWFFGGHGFDKSATTASELNDLWRYVP
ncbi:MAG: DUF4215 domain-containing protein [Spirochaetia bacterium]|nr:DUF4215 domain-containing protein [Spirochaetia bacterium]